MKMAIESGIKRIIGPFVLLAAIFGVSTLNAHPVSLSATLLHVDEDKIHAEIAIMVEDLYMYHELSAGSDFMVPRDAILEKGMDHKDFLRRYYHIRDRDGRRIEGRFVDVSFDDIPEDGVRYVDLMDHWIIYRMDFDLESRPEYITVIQDFDGQHPRIPAVMTMHVLHGGIPVDEAVLHHGTAHTTQLDWDMDFDALADMDPGAIWDKIQEQRLEDGLGITSYSRVYSYLYITETEVRHELLVPFMTLETWMNIERSSPDHITVDEQRAHSDRIGDFVKRQNRVSINGLPVEPEVQRVDFFGPEYRDFARESPGEDLSVYNTRVGVIMSFPAASVPQSVLFEWDHFGEYTPSLESQLLAFDEPRQNVRLHSRRNAYRWESDVDREPVSFSYPDPPESAEELQISLVSVAGVTSALLLIGMGMAGRASGRKRVLFLGLALCALLGGFSFRTVAEVSFRAPFSRPPPLEEGSARAVFEALHGNIYQAFTYRDEEQIYDALENSVAGPLLETLYLKIRNSMRMAEQSGAISRAESIEYLKGSHSDIRGSEDSTQSFEYHAEWTVTGRVEHWGHVHTRKNRYAGLFVIEGRDNGWKITHFEPLAEEPLEMRTRLRD